MSYHKRDVTFDASTEFQNYTTLFDQETRELLQKNNEPISAVEHHQPPLVNADEKEQIMKYHALRATEIKQPTAITTTTNRDAYTNDAAVHSIMEDASDRHFRKWQMSRRHTLDELERKGVIDANFFNFSDSQTQAQSAPLSQPHVQSQLKVNVNADAQVHPSSTRAVRGSPDKEDHNHGHDDDDVLPSTMMVPSNSVISTVSNLGDDDGDDDGALDSELYKHDLYYVLCHQIIPKSQQNVFQQMVQQSLLYNLHNPLHRGSKPDLHNDDDDCDAEIIDDEMVIDVSAVRNNNSNDANLRNTTAPPPTCVGTPSLLGGALKSVDDDDVEEEEVTPSPFSHAHAHGNGKPQKKHTDIAKVKSKLERHSQKLEKEKMRHLIGADADGLGVVHEALSSDSSDGDDEEEPQVQQQPQSTDNNDSNRQTMHMGNQRSIMSLMQNHHVNAATGAVTANDEYHNSFSFAPIVIREHSNPFLGTNGNETADVASKTPTYERSVLLDKQNAFNISYYCIPKHIDGGMLSSSIFLAYKQWCESSIVRFTEQAGMCLDQMKKESNMLEYLHRETILKTPAENLYDDHALYDDDDDDGDEFPSMMNGGGGTGGGGLLLDMDGGSGSSDLRQKREQHLKKLSQIDDNLADIRDKLRKMFRVQQHVQLLQQQYDTHIERIREDKSELLEIMAELRDRHRDCAAIAASIRHLEEWLIPNFTYSIAAERAEEVDCFNRRIKQLDAHSAVAGTVGEDDQGHRDRAQQKRKYSSIVEETQHFIGELHHLIQRLQKISESKQSEVDRLQSSMAQMVSQNAILVRAAQTSYRTVTDRLLELQTHYKLPDILDAHTETRGSGACEAVTASLSAYVKKVDCRDYHNRALELYHSAIIYSDERTKVFYNAFMFAVNAVLIDCMVVDEYIASNISVGGVGGVFSATVTSTGDDVVDVGSTQLSLALSDTPENDTAASTTTANSKTVGFKIEHSMKQSTDQILNDAFTPVSLEASTFSTFYPLQNEFEHAFIRETHNDPHKLLQHLCEHPELDVKFESLQLLHKSDASMVRKTQHLNRQQATDDEDSLLHRLKSISLFAHLLPYRENVMICVAQYVTMKYQQQIFALNYDKLKIKEYAQRQCCILLANVLFTNTNKRGIVRRIKKLCRLKQKQKRQQRTQSAAASAVNSGEEEEQRKERNNPFDLNVYRMAALILQNIYNIAIPFPM